MRTITSLGIEVKPNGIKEFLSDVEDILKAVKNLLLSPYHCERSVMQ